MNKILIFIMILSANSGFAMEKETHIYASDSTRRHTYIFSEEEVFRILGEELVRMGVVLPKGKRSIEINEPSCYGFSPYTKSNVEFKINEDVIITVEPKEIDVTRHSDSGVFE